MVKRIDVKTPDQLTRLITFLTRVKIEPWFKNTSKPSLFLLANLPEEVEKTLREVPGFTITDAQFDLDKIPIGHPIHCN